MVTVFYRHRPEPLGHHVVGPLGLITHESKIVDHLRLVKTATIFFALLVTANHHSVLQSLDVNIHLPHFKIVLQF